MLPHIKLAPSVIILYSALFSVRTDVYMLVLQLPEKLYYYIYIYIYILCIRIISLEWIYTYCIIHKYNIYFRIYIIYIYIYMGFRL